MNPEMKEMSSEAELEPRRRRQLDLRLDPRLSPACVAAMLAAVRDLSALNVSDARVQAVRGMRRLPGAAAPLALVIWMNLVC